MRVNSMETLHPIDIKVGRNIAKIRIRQGLSAQQLGARLNKPVSYQQIRKYERGENRVHATTLVELCCILNCDMVDLFSGVPELMRKNTALDPYAPPPMLPYIIDDSELNPEHKELFVKWTGQLNASLAAYLTRDKDINNA
jgi:transcriptional regulator with XRE-family HTH domain